MLRRLLIITFFGAVCLRAAFGDDAASRAQLPTENEFLLEAWRYRSLARLALLNDDYDNVVLYSAEAVRYAELSDEYLAGLARLTPALIEAEDLLRWAEGSGAYEYYKEEIDKARGDLAAAYAEKRGYHWDEALEFALLVKADLADVAAPPPKSAPVPVNAPAAPAQYKVRPWDEFGDCFWNIAKWFYNDPWKWPRLYEANKANLPDPDNPDWIEIGAVIELPDLDGKPREGFWDSGSFYAKD